MSKQKRYTKNVKVAMYLAECEHEANLIANKMEVFCHSCNKIIPARKVGNVYVSLDKDESLTAYAPIWNKAE